MTTCLFLLILRSERVCVIFDFRPDLQLQKEKQIIHAKGNKTRPKSALVLGGGGFIGNHMVSRLKKEGYFVRAVDLKYPEFAIKQADEFVLADLREPEAVKKLVRFGNQSFDEVYQFAADMGGAGYVFSGSNDSEIMHNSATINLNLMKMQSELNDILRTNKTRIFYSSSACVYPTYKNLDPKSPDCNEESAYPAMPDSEYGWEKIFSERAFLAFSRNRSLQVRIARFHNIFGPFGVWQGGKEKAPAAICRKVALAQDGDSIEVWGDGNQTRSFLYIDECIEATRRFMNTENFSGPINIGSEYMVSINQLVEKVSQIAKKEIVIRHIEGPEGVRGRNSSNDLLRKHLNWDFSLSLEQGLEKTYSWIFSQLNDQPT